MAVSNVDLDANITHRFSDVAGEPCIMLPPIEGLRTTPLLSLAEAVKPLVSIVHDIQTKALMAKERAKNPSDGLTSDESASIALYTMECNPYTYSVYYLLNMALRTEDRKQLEPWLLYLRLILNALCRLPSIRVTVYRSLKFDLTLEKERYQEGKNVYWWGFSACTMNKNISEKEHFLSSTGTRTLFAIECLHGKNIGEHSYHANEEEVLLLPGTRFEVVRCNRRHDDLHKIYMKEVESLFITSGKQTSPNALTSTDTETMRRKPIQKFFHQSLGKIFKE